MVAVCLIHELLSQLVKSADGHLEKGGLVNSDEVSGRE